MRWRELFGMGAVACAACCAVPVAAFVAGVLGIAVGTALFGLVGLAVVGAAVVLWWVMRRRSATACAVPSDDVPVSLTLGTRRRDEG